MAAINRWLQPILIAGETKGRQEGMKMVGAVEIPQSAFVAVLKTENE